MSDLSNLLPDLTAVAKKIKQENILNYDAVAMDLVKVYAASGNARTDAIPHLYYEMIAVRQAFLEANPNPNP